MGIPPRLHTSLSAAQPLSMFRMYWLHHSPFLDKITCLVYYLSLFVLPMWIRIKLPHHLPLWHASSGPSPYSFGWDAILTGDFPQRSLSGNPRIDPIFSPPPNHTLRIPWPMAHFSCIGWVQVGGALTLCACSTPSEFVSLWPSHHFCCPCIVWFCCKY